MWRQALAAVAIWGALSGCVQAYITGSFSEVNTVGIPGMFTYTLTVTAGAGEKFIGFDFASGPGYGVSGQLNQVNPVGLPTIFNDNNLIFPLVGADVSQDTQFKVRSTDGVVSNASESATSLKATFNLSPANIATATNTWSMLQLVPQTIGATFRGTFTVRNAMGEDRVDYVEGGTYLGGRPYAYDEVIDNVVADGPGITSSSVRYTNGADFSNLGNFRFDSYVPAPGTTGTGPAIPATFVGRVFNWNTHGSPLGTYKWLFTVSNQYGSDDGSITVHITQVPEPAAVGLLALAILACGVRSRHFSRCC